MNAYNPIVSVMQTCDLIELRNENGYIECISAKPLPDIFGIRPNDMDEWDYQPLDIYPIDHNGKRKELMITHVFSDGISAEDTKIRGR